MTNSTQHEGAGGAARDLFSLAGRTAIVTGGYGVLGRAMGAALARAGARVAVLGRDAGKVQAQVDALAASGADAMALVADVTDEAALLTARDVVLEEWGRIDILLNAAGGNVARARTDGRSPFLLPMDALDEVMRLNFTGTVLPTMVFGEAMAIARRGCIVTISSMATMRMLSGTMGYSAAKAAMENMTRWLAVDVATQFGDGLRVNAIAPGFFISTQNRAVLVNEDGSWTERASNILAQTPMGRFGRHEELDGALLFLCSDAASFVTGAVIPVDGGFSVASGV